MNIKIKHLLLGLLLDGIGYLSYLIPILGETTDFIWAPISAYILMNMYKGFAGQAAGAFEFLEELLPGTDFIPTFTLMWIYNYLLKSRVASLLKT